MNINLKDAYFQHTSDLLWGQSIPIPCSSIQTGFGSFNFQEMYGHNSGLVAGPMHPSSKLHVQLTDISSITEFSIEKPRITCKPPKECVAAESANNNSWREPGFL